MTLILASASPRRKQLLKQIGVRFEVCPADIDETVLPEESPTDYVKRMSEQKARVILNSDTGRDAVVIGSDTTVVCDQHIFGKPESEQDAIAMLTKLSGREHEVLSGICVMNTDREHYGLSRTRVWFKTISIEQMKRYWQSGEPCDKAGSYGIQGFGSAFIDRIEGSFSGVMGLPLEVMTELLKQFNVEIWQDIE
ncbi:Maf family protein [Gynuella sp.]|uniref:Maf family protein n=1 Tax=Gynuella sp. TaxID=2969146 RepID=UPI003D1339FD